MQPESVLFETFGNNYIDKTKLYQSKLQLGARIELQLMDQLDNEAKAEALYQQLKAATSYSQRTALEYEKCIELNPKHIGALWEAARFYDGEFDYPGSGSYWDEFNCANSQKAVAFLRRIIELDPKFSEAYKRLAKYCGQDKEKSLQYYLEYLNQKPQDYSVIANIGHLYHCLNRPQEAIVSYTKCIQYNKADQIALHGLASVYEGLGNYADALQCLRKCNQINSKSVETHAQLGRVYDKMGRIKEALNSYRWCIQLQSGHKQAHAYLKRHSGLKH